MSKSSPVPWVAQAYDENDDGIGILSLKDGGTNPSNGIVAWVSLFPSEILNGDSSRAAANANLIVKAVNNHSNLVEALERVQFDMKRIGNLAPDTMDMIAAALALCEIDGVPMPILDDEED